MQLQKGSTGQVVVKWQKFLIDAGFLAGSIDGVFGTMTEKATVSWQSRNELEADGIVGKASLARARTMGFKHTESSLWYPPRPVFSSPSPKKVQEMFGTFKYQLIKGGEIRIIDNWTESNIVDVKIPQLRNVVGSPKNGIVKFHKKGADQLREMFSEVERQGLSHLIISWAGSFYPRLVRGSSNRLSNHSWGSAFDINAAENWLGQQPAKIGQKGTLLQLVPIANAFGFFWGGHYQSRLDGMHFELAELGKFPTEI